MFHFCNVSSLQSHSFRTHLLDLIAIDLNLFVCQFFTSVSFYLAIDRTQTHHCYSGYKLWWTFPSVPGFTVSGCYRESVTCSPLLCLQSTGGSVESPFMTIITFGSLPLALKYFQPLTQSPQSYCWLQSRVALVGNDDCGQCVAH